jgi:hypothetical protein
MILWLSRFVNLVETFERFLKEVAAEGTITGQ